MFERYTEPARRSLFYARYEAVEYGVKVMEAEHLLLGLLREDQTFLTRFLPKEVTAETIRSQVEEETGMRKGAFKFAELPFSSSAKQVLRYAQEESDALSQEQAGLEHLLLGLLREEGTVVANVLQRNGLKIDAVRWDVS